MAVGNERPGFRAARCVSKPVDHVVEAGLEDLKQVQTRQATPTKSFLIVAAELPLENALHAASLLLGTQLTRKV